MKNALKSSRDPTCSLCEDWTMVAIVRQIMAMPVSTMNTTTSAVPSFGDDPRGPLFSIMS